MVTYVRLSDSTRTVKEWRWAGGEVGSWKEKLKRYAREHGAGMALRSDGSGVLYFLDRGKIRQRTFPEILIRH